MYHDWPHEAALISVAHVAEMREAGWREGGLQLGGATTLAEAIQLLRAPEAPAAAAQQLGALAQHLEQVAGGWRGRCNHARHGMAYMPQWQPQLMAAPV